MFMESIKRYGMSFLLASAILLSGCQSTENDPQISNTNTSAPTQNTANKDDPISTVPDNSEIITDVTKNETDTTPAETTEKVLEHIPDEWICIDDSFSTIVSFNSIINADCSKGEISDIIYSLVRKNVLYSLTKWGCTFEIDWDNPVTYGEDELTLYPAISVFFHDVKSIYDLANSVYGTNDKIYTYDSDTNSFYSYDCLFFTEIDGKMYVDPNCTVAKGAAEPFSVYTYIEITEQTEDKCKLTWHYPDVKGLNEPDKYLDYYYYEGHFTARYVDGAWRLDRVIGY